MDDRKFASRCIGALLLAQMLISPIANFTLLDSVTGGEGGFLVNAAPHATQAALSALLLMVVALIGMGIGIVMWPILRQRSERMALGLVILGGSGVALTGFESAGLLSMVSLSKAYVAVPAADEALYQGLRGVVAAQRNWAHFVHLLMSGATLLVFHSALLRFGLVPRALAGLGVLGAVSQMISVSMPFFGYPVVFPMLAPLGVAQILLAVTVLWKGLRA